MAALTDTVIYLDIDGVLNVGIGDGGVAPLLLNDINIKMAMDVKDPSLLAPQERGYVDKVITVANRPLGSTENGTYSSYACPGSDQFVDILLARLADIIRAADDPFVVLASNWRKPKYKNKVRGLEEAISRHMGCKFVFDGATGLVNEKGAVDRLKCIGEHVNMFCTDPARVGAVRVLVLDDFFVSASEGWAMGGGLRIGSEADVESFLQHCANVPNVSIKMVHCYIQWLLNTGRRVEVGTGLTIERTRAAMEFLGVGGRLARQPSTTSNDSKGTGEARWAEPTQSAEPKRSPSRVNRVRTFLSRAVPMVPKKTRASKGKTAVQKVEAAGGSA
mmetsp:Transcript_85629/g.247163  ORF Transcript_85629/g.247163 Transcript_85629/m.247163 type:complete len:333 (-) Transcript_85629:552-1550(-)